MNRKNVKLLAPIFGMLMLVGAPAMVGAQVLELPFTGGLPPTVDFGDVEVGMTGQMNLIIRNVSVSASFDVQNVDLPPIPGGAFAMVDPFTSVTLAPGQEIAVPFAFTPPSEGIFNDIVTVTWMASSTGSLPGFPPPVPGAPALVQLTGNGISGAMDPLALIGSIIDDFHTGVAVGSIQGVGRGHSAIFRLRALGFMLNSVEWLIWRGYYDWAAWALCSAYKHLDGYGRPGDFATGPGLESIRSDILTLFDLLQ